MTVEQKLLIDAAGNRIKSGAFSAEKTDWREFIKLAVDQRVIPLVFHNLQPFSADLPPEIFKELQARAQKVSMGNLELNRQLLKIAQLFQANEIEFLAYKGSTLARLAYADSSLRQFGDLDILIRKKDFPKTKKIILENGGKSDWELTAKQEKAVLKYYYEFPFLLGESQTLLEVHWSFMQSFFGFDVDIDKIFERSRTISIHGREIPTLSVEDLLIFLCVHGSKHFWTRLSWICDVAKLTQNQPVDWETTVKLAKINGCLRMLLLGLSLAADLFEMNLPKKIADQIVNDREVSGLNDIFKKQLFNKNLISGSEAKNIHLKMRERRLDKFRYSQRLFMTKVIDSLFMPMGRPR